CKKLFKKLKSDDDDLEQDDRISSLPDAVLAHILSLLPSKDFVVSTVLLRRWSYVFTGITCHDIDDSPISHSLIGCTSANLIAARPFKWPVKELDICAHVRKPGHLPMEIFGCQTLEMLKLDVNLRVHLQVSLSSLSLCLPNLKEYQQRTNVVLAVPNLEYLAYTDDCLPETIFSLAWLLPNVQRFFIKQGCVEPLHYCKTNLRLPVFQNLKHLLLGCFGYCDRNRVLLELLNCAS
ncbi:hypothetical protein RDABS01_014193, partial [Bienertia sinuspersici]